MKLREIERIKGLLTQALNATSSDHSLAEVKSHIRQAIGKINQAKNKSQRLQSIKTQYEQWWGNIQSGVANLAMANMTAETQMKTLKQLNALIGHEQEKLAELEKTANEDDSDLLTD